MSRAVCAGCLRVTVAFLERFSGFVFHVFLPLADERLSALRSLMAETILGGGQGAPSDDPATIDQDGPDSVHPRAIQPLGHGVEEAQRDRAARAQQTSYAAQAEVVAVLR